MSPPGPWGLGSGLWRSRGLMRRVAVGLFGGFLLGRSVLLMPARQGVRAALGVGEHRQGDD